MSKLIAMVATAVMVDGVRTVIQPGEALPDLSKHDERELLANGLAMDPTVEAANDKAKKIEEAAALDSFRAARERVQAEQESIKPAEQATENDVSAQGNAAPQKPAPAAKSATSKK